MTDMEIACLGLSRDGAAVFIDRYDTDRRLVVFQERCRILKVIWQKLFLP